MVAPATKAVEVPRTGGYLPIESYAAIGDCRTLALVGSDGSIDWFCWPRFDSEPLFTRIIDARGGYFAIAPAGEYRARREYRRDSNVLVTRFETESGTCQVTDLFAAVPVEHRRRMLLPETLIVRRVEGLSGTVPLEIAFEPRAGFANRPLSYRYTNDQSVAASLPGNHLLHLAADVPLSIGESGVGARFAVAAGEAVTFALALTADEPAVFPPLHAISEVIELTDGYWKKWSSRCTPDVPDRDLVVRSALALKLLSHSPSGAIIASPTTSLPEVPGGERNWDYRYCWLRDASLTVRAFMGLGYEDEARAFTQWMLHATRLTRPRLQVLYDAYGRQPAAEREVSGLDGYRGARPVRAGNGASGQTQLDIYGEVIDAVAECHLSGDPLSRDERRFTEDLVKYVLEHWEEPDHGIWEKRGDPKQYVDSKVMCWVALDRAAKLSEKGLIGIGAGQLRSAADAIREFVRAKGYSERLGAFSEVAGEDSVDAALLRMPIAGFCEPGDPLMMATIEAIRGTLSRGELVFRGEEQVVSGEGAFVACSFWLSDCLARQGRLDEARRAFAALAARANDVGLYSEEIDAEDGRFLGNFPLAFSHTALINAALTIGKEGRA